MKSRRAYSAQKPVHMCVGIYTFLWQPFSFIPSETDYSQTDSYREFTFTLHSCTHTRAPLEIQSAARVENIVVPCNKIFTMR